MGASVALKQISDRHENAYALLKLEAPAEHQIELCAENRNSGENESRDQSREIDVIVEDAPDAGGGRRRGNDEEIIGP